MERILWIGGAISVIWLIGGSCASCRETRERHEALDVVVARQQETKRSEKASADREAREKAEAERKQRRDAAFQVELTRPLADRVAETQERLTDNGPSSENMAREVCYADFLLSGHEDELRSLKKARNRAAKKAVADRREELSAARYLLCRDGTTSNTCECAGPRSGCCSSHGGVARCEPKPTVEIDCSSWAVEQLVEQHLSAVGRPMPSSLAADSREWGLVLRQIR